MHIDYANLGKQTARYRAEIDAAIKEIIDGSNFILGQAVDDLEAELSAYVDADHAITCSSGTDALLLAMMALDIGPGDEVITTPFTFIATAETIALLHAKPVFVDIEEDSFNIDPSKIEQAITAKTKAIMPVSLFGQVADMDAINAIAKRHQLPVIEDAAQSFGATYKGKRSCNVSDIGCTSFFPAKPLGCFGDGGALFTNNGELAEKIKSLRVHGQTARYYHPYIGMGGRLDALQAAILRVKLAHYPADLRKRQDVARAYQERLSGNQALLLPEVKGERDSAWAQFSVRVQQRETVQQTLKEQGIPTAVHYPLPLHLQPCFSYLGYEQGALPIAEKISDEIMSLPLSPDHTLAEINYICEKLNSL